MVLSTFVKRSWLEVGNFDVSPYHAQLKTRGGVLLYICRLLLTIPWSGSLSRVEEQARVKWGLCGVDPELPVEMPLFLLLFYADVTCPI